MKRIVFFGATSAIATACARRWAGEGAAFVLFARDPEKLGQVAADLRARGAAKTEPHPFSATDYSAHTELIELAANSLGGEIDIALIAYGTLPDQKACEQNSALAAQAIAVNATSVIALTTAIANRMEKQGAGTLAVISSVAGDRGRASNYVYGSAKAAVSTFCDGLRARVAKFGVHVVTIKPGFVATPMTKGLPLPAALTATPDQVAADIVKAVARRKATLYTPRFWSLIMFVIRALPEPIFKRLNL
jgi:decaprenylphospho-beta-D-erythro-pentofuranosid-2-ulose 2-reductase